MADIAIKVNKVYKNFKLPHEKADSIKKVFTNPVGYIKNSGNYEEQHALKDISLEVKKGEFFGIVGRNGSGKSTLLKIIAGIYQPTKGTVQVNGRLVPFIELGVGFNAELTGRENVYLNGALMGFTKKQIDEQYDQIVEFAEIGRFMDQKLKNYSSGMQVRLAFSMAIRSDADILLIDEVLAVGDADFQRKCFEYFRSLKRNKKTVIFVSHDMNAVREYCDRAVMIEKSELVAEGDPEKIAVEYTRIFTDKDRKVGEQENGKRWGNGALRYTKVIAKPTSLQDSQPVKLTLQAEALKQIENPIFGFGIKNSAGQHLLGTNTKIKHLKVPTLKPGERVSVEWEVPNVFADGQYQIDLAIVEADGLTECDWWEDAVSFTVYKEEKTPYAINPDIKAKVTGDQ
jgi:ABC-2 type transport system ATP-binding protein